MHRMVSMAVLLLLLAGGIAVCVSPTPSTWAGVPDDEAARLYGGADDECFKMWKEAKCNGGPWCNCDAKVEGIKFVREEDATLKSKLSRDVKPCGNTWCGIMPQLKSCMEKK
jgi:hypothetical protein